MKQAIIQYLKDQLEADRFNGYIPLKLKGMRSFFWIKTALLGPGYYKNHSALKGDCDELVEGGILRSVIEHGLKLYKIEEEI